MNKRYEYDSSISKLLESAEIAKDALLKHLQTKDKKEIINEVLNMDKNSLKKLNQWALEGEIYEVCAALKEILNKKDA
ncbi:hypothetical protein [Aureibaculum conchae]|uniref:hypothetical protein n=1 Tax=Aureibaculum sp. 2308TA14-22 TaxID=3108392 RepID=UPI00339A19D3